MTGPELIDFIDANVKLNERAVLTLFFAKPYTMRLWSEIKKSGKTFLAACILLSVCFTRKYAETVCVANDEEQAQSRVFQTCCDLCEQNPELKASVVKKTANELRFSNGSAIRAVASEYKGAAGGRQDATCFDELWCYDSERAARLFDEMRPAPTTKDAFILIVSYAGFSGESTVLERLYERAVKAKRIHRSYEVTADGSFVCFWSHTPRQPWQTREWLRNEEKDLAARPNQFRRLYRNEWVSSESTFITGEAWDACTDSALVPMLEKGVLHLGVDIGIKNDSTGVVGVMREGDRVRVALHRCWKPWLNRPVNLTDVESYILELREKHHVVAALVDPSQALHLLQRLVARGVPIQEFPQTVSNCVQMGSTLFSLVNNRNLVSYESAELREHVTNAVGLETERGIRMIKSKVSKKIDLAIALAMASVSAVCGPIPLDLNLLSINGVRFTEFKDPNYVDHPMDRLMNGRGIDVMGTIESRWKSKLWDS